jgi:DNA polymerase-3 subunit epsilon
MQSGDKSGSATDFVALDVETANADMSSICQIGIACFTDGKLVHEWSTYIDPEDYFDFINVSIHGIDEHKVQGAPTLPFVADQIADYVRGKVVVSHTHFDRVAMLQGWEKYRLTFCPCMWLDSARVARRAWERFARRGFGIHNICSDLGYLLTHHDALEDAKAAGHILLAAIKETGLDVTGWLQRVAEPINNCRATDGIVRFGDPEGPCYGEVLAFTGALRIPRGQASDMAAKIGCVVAAGVTKETTILVVGDQDIRKLAGHDKSSKHRKAEKLICEGQSICILRESDFEKLVNCIGEETHGVALRT